MHLMTPIWPILTYFLLQNILLYNCYHWCKDQSPRNLIAFFKLFSHFLPKNQGTKNSGDTSRLHIVDNVCSCYRAKIGLVICKSVAYRGSRKVEILWFQMHLLTPIWPILTYFFLQTNLQIQPNICYENDVSICKNAKF